MKSVINRQCTFDDDALPIFLTTLARRCNRPYGRGVDENHLVRKNQESISDHVERLYIEYDTVVDSEEQLSTAKLESEITQDIYNYLRYRDNLKVRQIIMYCAQQFLMPMNDRSQLEKLAANSDNCMVDGPGSLRTISGLNQSDHNNADSQRGYM